MSVKRNVGISLLSQAFFVGTRLLVVPIYLHLMGIEAYGLVGLFVLLTALIQLLNFGVSATASRELSRMKGGAINSATIHHQLRQALVALGGISAIFAAIVALLAPFIAAHWLHVSTISPTDVTTSLRLMGAAAGLAFASSLFKGGLIAVERQVMLNALNSAITALRSLGVIAALVAIAPTPVVYCAYQLVISILEFVVFRMVFYRILPPSRGEIDRSQERSSERRRFAGGLALTDLVWAGVLQVDRLVLSTALSLAMFGYFTVMSTAAYGVLLLSSPVIQSVQPRFTVLAAEGKFGQLRTLYFRVTYGVTALAFSASSVFIFFPKAIIFAWTGNPAIADWSAAIMPAYVAGNALVGVLSLPFLLQFALGDIRLHVRAHLVEAMIYIPIAVFLGFRYGAQGTALAWLGTNLLYFLVAVPLIHQRVLPGDHGKWLVACVLPALVLPLMIGLVCALIPLPQGRLNTATVLCLYGALSLLVTLSANRHFRDIGLQMLDRGWSRARATGKWPLA